MLKIPPAFYSYADSNNEKADGKGGKFQSVCSQQTLFLSPPEAG